MKYRAPRKKKKKAKKLKAGNDAIIMARTAMITAQSCVQLAVLSSTPIGSAFIGEKILRAVTVTIDAAKAVANSIADIKHWTHFVPNYRMR